MSNESIESNVKQILGPNCTTLPVVALEDPSFMTVSQSGIRKGGNAKRKQRQRASGHPELFSEPSGNPCGSVNKKGELSPRSEMRKSFLSKWNEGAWHCLGHKHDWERPERCTNGGSSLMIVPEPQAPSSQFLLLTPFT